MRFDFVNSYTSEDRDYFSFFHLALDRDKEGIEFAIGFCGLMILINWDSEFQF